MLSCESIRQRFVAALQRPEIDLAEAALLIAQEEEQTIDVSAYLTRLDELGRRARVLVEQAPSALARIEALNTFLFTEERFCGNEWDYYDPRNSFLNQVLDRRTGIPITLSIIYLEIGRRAGIEKLEGLGLPGHFMVRSSLEDQPIFIDPFNKGLLRNEIECRRYIAARFGTSAASDDQLFSPVSARQILARLLRNLKAIYIRRADARRALAAVERILLLEPDSPQEVRDRGLLRLRRGDLMMGLNDLERYGALEPQAIDLEDIRRQAEGIAGFIALRN